MRKSCAQFVHSSLVACGRTHDLCARCIALLPAGGQYWTVIPRLCRIPPRLFYTAQNTLFSSVKFILFPTIHMANNNYNSVYIHI
jgi:hypothetical protein